MTQVREHRGNSLVPFSFFLLQLAEEKEEEERERKKEKKKKEAKENEIYVIRLL